MAELNDERVVVSSCTTYNQIGTCTAMLFNQYGTATHIGTPYVPLAPKPKKLVSKLDWIGIHPYWHDVYE